MQTQIVDGLGDSLFTIGRSGANPRTSANSFQVQGLTLFLPWDVNLSQSINVVPDKAYNVAIRGKYANAKCNFSGFFNEAPLFTSSTVSGESYKSHTAKIPSKIALVL